MKIDDIKNGDTLSLKQFKEMGLQAQIGQKRKSSSSPSARKGNEELILGNSSTSKKKRNSKFNAKKTEVDGIVFDSKFEAERYSILKLQERAKEIKNLQLQVPYSLEVNGHKICDYIADFVFEENGVVVVEDAKGVKTPEYRLKKKLMKACLGIDIRETYKKKATA